MVFYLVKYVQDGILQVVPKVFKRGSTIIAKYFDGKYYHAEVLGKNPSHYILDEILKNLQIGLPVVLLDRQVTPWTNQCSEEKGILTEAMNHSFIILTDENFNICDYDYSGIPEMQDTICLAKGSVLDEIQVVEAEDLTVQNSLSVAPGSVLDEIQVVEAEDLTVQNSLSVAPGSVLDKIQVVEAEDSTVQNSLSVTPGNKQKKVHQKKHCCFYCQKLLYKIYRHYINVHKNEKDIREIIVLPNKSAHRKLLLDNLRKKGDFFFNTSIRSENEKQILCKETLKDHLTLRDENVPCPRCMGFYSKFSLRHHIKKCMEISNGNRRSNLQAESRKLVKNIHEKASDDLRLKIFPFFNEDEVTNAIRYDEAIIIYGNYLCRKYTLEHHAQQIRSNLRSFGRLILAIRETNPHIKNLFDVLDTSFVDLIINGIDKVSGLNKVTHLYRAPSTALLLATELKKLCKLLITEFARKRDKDGQKRMEDLQLIFNLEFHVTINKRSMETQKINNRRRKTILPKTKQIAHFRVYLEKKILHYINLLEKSFSQSAWVHLAEYTLVHLAVFNRKRPGETQRILIDDYKNYEVLQDEDVADDTDSLSREQIKKWARIRFTGKLGKNTALLVHRSLGFKAINLILKYRGRAGVNPVNRYVFGEPSDFHAQKTFQACQLLRNFAYDSGIENPELLRTRLLRQHLATETATLSVDQRLEERVSDFMSHKKQIHQDYYVMTQKRDDITKVSQLLEDFSSNKRTYQGFDNQKPSTSVQSNDDSDVISSDENENVLSQAEMNFLMGKNQIRRSWTKMEKDKARQHFHDEIFFGDQLSRKKVHHFFEMNKTIYGSRTPHLIMQWIKCQRKEVLADRKGKKGFRSRWSTPEKELLHSSTERHSMEGTTPTITECELILEENKDILKNRTAASVKSFLYSERKRKQKS